MAHSSHIDPNGRNQDWRPPYDYSWVWLWFETTGDTFRQISRMFRLLPRVCHFDPALYQSGTDFCFLAPTILIEGVAQRPLVSNSTLGWPNQWWYQFWRIFFRWSVKTLRVILCQNYPAWLYYISDLVRMVWCLHCSHPNLSGERLGGVWGEILRWDSPIIWQLLRKESLQ